MSNMIHLHRMGTTPWGTFGKLWVPDCPLLYTVENEWLDNHPNVSCIPADRYRLELDTTTERYHVRDVPGRTAIQFHAGNTEDDTQGCILPGTSWGVVNGKPGVMSSSAALTLLRQKLDTRADWQIDICWEDYL